MPKPSSSSSRLAAILVTIVGLGLVWGLVWANMPGKDQLHGSGVSSRTTNATPPTAVLDLSIPGVPAPGTSGSHRVVVNGSEVPQQGQGTGGAGALRSKQITEMKCEAELQQVCPDSLQGEDRRQCMAQRAKQLPSPCQAMVRQQLVRWKEQSGHAVACADDVKRFCPDVQPGEGQMVQCLQDHAQDVSDGCYATLPKGALTLRN